MAHKMKFRRVSHRLLFRIPTSHKRFCNLHQAPSAVHQPSTSFSIAAVPSTAVVSPAASPHATLHAWHFNSKLPHESVHGTSGAQQWYDYGEEGFHWMASGVVHQLRNVRPYSIRMRERASHKPPSTCVVAYATNTTHIPASDFAYNTSCHHLIRQIGLLNCHQRSWSWSVRRGVARMRLYCYCACFVCCGRGSRRGRIVSGLRGRSRSMSGLRRKGPWLVDVSL